MKTFFVLLLTLNIFYTFTRGLREDEDIQKVGFAQYIIIDNIINLGGDNCSTRRPQIRRAEAAAINCLSNLNINNSYCSSLETDFARCIKPLVQKVEECNSEPTLHGMIQASVEATIAQGIYICNNDVKNIFELINPCFLRALELKEPCVETFMMDIQSFTRTNRNLLGVTCQAATSMKKCLNGTIDNECNNDITKTTIQDIYETITKPCKK
ncbi:hypothetical protein HHI36_008638 [Cryptolaemus montrouzieri]|uniref:Uncharacterized protein n=1 Tax=Cryptolaemus montrouzieri TaxID=559131 RepID=A0ABD2MT79_9CUCU